MSALQVIFSLLDVADPYRAAPAGLRDLQLEALRERFAEKRRQIPILIEDEAWLAADVFVAPGVTIGRGAVVGSRSSVFSDLPPMMVCVGSPARPVHARL